jgi:hypothetical protein
MDQIVVELCRSAMEYYPERSQLRNMRIVRHTPKNDYYIYDIVVDFADGSERLAKEVPKRLSASALACDLASCSPHLRAWVRGGYLRLYECLVQLCAIRAPCSEDLRLPSNDRMFPHEVG